MGLDNIFKTSNGCYPDPNQPLKSSSFSALRDNAVPRLINDSTNERRAGFGNCDFSLVLYIYVNLLFTGLSFQVDG